MKVWMIKIEHDWKGKRCWHWYSGKGSSFKTYTTSTRAQRVADKQIEIFKEKGLDKLYNMEVTVLQMVPKENKNDNRRNKKAII